MDITEWRVEFETRAIVESVRRGGDDWEAEIVTAFHLLSRVEIPDYDGSAKDWAAYGKKHSRFHDALAASCGSPWLLYFRGVLSAQARRYQALAIGRRDPQLFRNFEDHRAIMDAALARDENKAAKLIEIHIRRTAETALKELKTADVIDTSSVAGARKKKPKKRAQPASARRKNS